MMATEVEYKFYVKVRLSLHSLNTVLQAVDSHQYPFPKAG